MPTEKKYGIVYLLTNPVMPGLVKIGMTAQEDIDKRMKELYTTGVPVPFECQFACKVKTSDCAKIEKALHTAFSPQRINANREFFKIQVEQAKAILELFHHEDVTENVSEEIQNDLTDEDKAASSKAQTKRPPLNFYEMGLQKGDVLIWKEDASISVTILSERKVCYKGEETSISALSAQLKGYKVKHIQPTPHWLFNDRPLSEIYDETYPFEE
ncbi:GIY-YIG nuclease family protein [Pseudoprevotella muciniphila]|uniref:GIY-YIG nuclease family protein n=1 Tax=Pseudoprevotella muciniphila TaxID=2133944 RepID=A0A5P8E3I6_9BACT|nr:GIY-YIG nuclease family protein [Pseudoprevotella muciniphila]QFQ11587.1 GIY-YIG nuclease family protein [Pseudoprevotella muciniphila]